MNSIKWFFQIIFYTIKISISLIFVFFKCLGFILKLIGKIFYGLNRKFKKLFRFSLTFKITFVYALIISLILFLSSFGILLGFRLFLMHNAGKDIKDDNSILLSYINESIELPIDKIDGISKCKKLIITVFNDSKEIIYTSSDSGKDTYFHKNFGSPSTVRQIDKEILILDSEIHLDENILYLQLTRDLTSENNLLSILFIILLIANTICIIVTIAVGFKQSQKMLSPIKDMTERVKAITVQNLDTRLDINGAYDELRDLAVTFNEMFDKIQASYEKQNQFVSDASHELRTPISVIQGYINLLDRWGKGDKEVLDESIVAIKGESEAMKNLIEKLLFLARSDKNLLNLQKEDFSVDELIDEIIYETKLIDSSHTIIGETSENVSFYGDRKLLKQAVRIFVDNSVKFTPKGGTIKISSCLQKRQLIITVADTGIGIPKEDIKDIFNRFYRSDKSRTKETGGHGLGLSIAKLIVDEHKGFIKVESVVDVGTKMKILLPLDKNI